MNKKNQQYDNTPQVKKYFISVEPSSSDKEGKEPVSEFGIKEIEQMAASFAHDYKFYKAMRFILSGMVVLSLSMIYIILTMQNPPMWLGIIGWVMFAGSAGLDLFVANAQVASAEVKIKMFGYTADELSKRQNHEDNHD